MQLTAAVIGPAIGLKGEVHLDVRTDDPDLLVPGAVLDTDSPAHPRLTIVRTREQKNRVIALFDEIDSRTRAEEVRGVALLVDAHEEEDAWYPHELTGLRVLTPEGGELGEVTGLQAGAAQDLLLVRHEGRTVMVPFVRQLVPSVDVAGGTVTVVPLPGLFDDDVIDAEDRGGAR